MASTFHLHLYSNSHEIYSPSRLNKMQSYLSPNLSLPLPNPLLRGAAVYTQVLLAPSIPQIPK
jgi:hypothetical protein